MKPIILILLFGGIMSIVHGQIIPAQFGNKSWKSKYETTVINVGDSTCNHVWQDKPSDADMLNSRYGVSCLVIHDERGCPDKWGRSERICEKCLRKELISEVRYFPQEELDRAAEQRKKQQDAVNKWNELEKKIKQ